MPLYTQNMNLTTVLSEIYIYSCASTDKVSSFPLCNLPTPMPSLQIAAVGLCMYSSTVGHIHIYVHIYILVSCLCTKGLHILCLTILSQPRKNNPASSICERGCGGMHEDIYYSCVPAPILCDFILHNRGEITAQFSCYLKIYPRYSYILIQRDIRTQ